MSHTQTERQRIESLLSFAAVACLFLWHKVALMYCRRFRADIGHWGILVLVAVNAALSTNSGCLMLQRVAVLPACCTSYAAATAASHMWISSSMLLPSWLTCLATKSCTAACWHLQTVCTFLLNNCRCSETKRYRMPAPAEQSAGMSCQCFKHCCRLTLSLLLAVLQHASIATHHENMPNRGDYR